MSNSAQHLMQKAALLLDESGDVEGAEAALRDAINVAMVSGSMNGSSAVRTPSPEP